MPSLSQGPNASTGTFNRLKVEVQDFVRNEIKKEVEELEDNMRTSLFHKLRDELKEELVVILQFELRKATHASNPDAKQTPRPFSSTFDTSQTSSQLPVLEKDWDTWRFGLSCWDAVIFVFDGDILHNVESIWILFVLLLNVCMQSCFIIIIFLSLAKTSLDDETLDGYHLWRTNIGHAAQYFDPLTGLSLATRVCFGDSSLALSEGQSRQISEIEAYLYENTPFNGPLLCSLALLSWSLTVIKELQEVLGMISSFRHLPHGVTKTIVENSAKVTSVSCRRFVLVCLLAVMRVIIALCLLLAGTQYVAVTISIENIILNAVALGFVFNIDELLYSALVPRKTKRFIASLKPLPLGSSFFWLGLDANVCATLALIVGFFMGAIFLVMLPEIGKMKKAKQELCGGEQQFIFSFPRFGAVVWGTDGLGYATSLEHTLEVFRKTTRYDMLRRIISAQDDNTYVNGHKLHGTGAGWSVVNMDDWPLMTVGKELNARCEDILSLGREEDSVSFFARFAFHDATGNQSFAVCRDARPYCSDGQRMGTFARLYCPDTCGCADPMSQLAVASPVDGCPETCTEQQNWKHSKDIALCVDRPSHMPSGELDSLWIAFLASWREFVGSWVPEHAKPFLQYANDLEKNGCQGVVNTSLCSDVWLKPLAIFCPETCKCSKTHALYCPGTC